MKLMAVDFGLRRIGIAVTDDMGIVVRGLPTIDRKKVKNSITAVCEIIATELPAKVIFGVPLGPDDQETKISAEARIFARNVSEISGVEIDFIDESFSSKDAEKLLHLKKKKKRRDKSAVDRIAACLILQQYQRENGTGYYL